MNQFLRAAVTLLFLSAGFQASSALASPNSIRKVQTRAEGSALIVQIEMESDVSANPGTWSIVEPPRIVLDFPETTNKTGSNTESVAMGDIKSLNIVQTDQLTRLVLNLYRTAQYSIDSKGRNVVVRIEPRSSVANTDGSVAAPSRLKVVDATKPQSVLSTQNASVRDIRFQRGEEGQGLLLIGLSDGTVPVDVRREGNLLTVEMPGTELPQRLKARRDVNDFATPVTFVTAKTVGAVARFELAARGKWFHQSRVTNNELAIEIRQIPPDDANKLVQAGQQGQKVSINFFEAEATMVLRTLAEISGKNVMIDPSLAGRRITVALDNIPYDQAIEIVMAQVNAGMRLNDTIVLFGDRTVLQKRDQDRADDQTRAADIAQLVSETFELNYVKVADVESLISAVPTQGAAAGTTAPPGQPAQAPTAAAASKGMLSARGSMTKHEPTNKLFVRDTEERVGAIREVIRSIDVPAKQVLIEARIVRADTNFSRALGVRLGYQDLSGTVAGNGIGTRIGKSNAYGAIAGSSADLVTRTGQDVGG